MLIQTSSLFSINSLPSWIQELLSSCTYPWQVLDLLEKTLNTEYPVENRLKQFPSSALIEGNVFIEEGAIIEPHCYIKGPTWISKGATVRHGAYIRGGVAACEGSVIGHCTEVKNALFLPKAKAGHFAYIGDSILGSNTNLGAGVRLANLRLDQREVCLKWQNRLYETKRRKCGAFIGDGSQVGCNSVLNPGCLLGKNSIVQPLSCLSGAYEAPQTKLN